MKNRLTLLLFVVTTHLCFAQEGAFKFGEVTYKDLNLQSYPLDSVAKAVVLKEFGEAWISNADYDLVFKFHTRIKILQSDGLSIADYEIPLYKTDDRFEQLLSVKASSFNIENGSMREVKLDQKQIYTVDQKNWDIKKFAIPNVKVGSVIEVEYEIKSPFVYNFRSWEFQSDIPKIYSEYSAKIPGNYEYNMTLKGSLPLSKKEASLIKDCLSAGTAKADCAHYRYAMNDVPAFKKEKFMLAESNYKAAINFELSVIRYFDGRIQRFTEEWSDAVFKLNKDQQFGVQLKKGKDISEQITSVLSPGDDDLTRAKNVYQFIKNWYQWNDTYGKYSEFGIKKAFERRTGNVGDINLSLVAALRSAGLNANPVILSTRENGLPTEVHPVISDFNYVVAATTIGEKLYLLDATEDLYPFGLLPERCLNGNGRLLIVDKSEWVELKAPRKSRTVYSLTLQVKSSGDVEGVMKNTYSDYAAIDKRKEIYRSASYEKYLEQFSGQFYGLQIDSTHYEALSNIEKPLIEIMHFNTSFSATSNSLFNPFLLSSWKDNPFISNERAYPVDFGVPIDYHWLVRVVLPDNYEVTAPQSLALALPDNGGRLIVQSTALENMLTLSIAFQINKSVFSSNEYHFLKELTAILVKTLNTDLLVKRKDS